MTLPQVLLLAGTAEARELAQRLSGMPLRLTVSLAGATRKPQPYPGCPRIGGFGGADGLARWLRDHAVAALIDATHPYAVKISANAGAAAGATGCPLLRLERPPWEAGAGEQWVRVRDLPAAIAALPTDARGLLATGSGSVAQLGIRKDVALFLRAIEPLGELPDHVHPIRMRPPFSLGAEIALLQEHRITHLVTRNSGGAGRARLEAAARLKVSVLMIDRPAPPRDGDRIETVGAAVDWLVRRLALDTPSAPAP